MQAYGGFSRLLHRSVLALNPGGQFLPNWHIDAIAHVIEQSGPASHRLIINLPPRHLKSIMVSVLFRHSCSS